MGQASLVSQSQSKRTALSRILRSLENGDAALVGEDKDEWGVKGGSIMQAPCVQGKKMREKDNFSGGLTIEKKSSERVKG